MPTIRINDSTFRALQRMAQPLVDTPGSVIDRLLRDHAERTGESLDPDPEYRSSPPQVFDPASPPGLTHTVIESAIVDNSPLERTRWAALMLETIHAIAERGLSGQALADALDIRARTDVFEKNGYRHYPELGLSIQGRSAQDSWRETARLAARHGIPVEVNFRWRDRPEADYPGGKGTMVVG